MIENKLPRYIVSLEDTIDELRSKNKKLRKRKVTRQDILLEMVKVYETQKGCALLPGTTIEQVLGKYADAVNGLVNGEEG